MMVLHLYTGNKPAGQLDYPFPRRGDRADHVLRKRWNEH